MKESFEIQICKNLCTEKNILILSMGIKKGVVIQKVNKGKKIKWIPLCCKL